MRSWSEVLADPRVRLMRLGGGSELLVELGPGRKVEVLVWEGLESVEVQLMAPARELAGWGPEALQALFEALGAHRDVAWMAIRAIRRRAEIDGESEPSVSLPRQGEA